MAALTCLAGHRLSALRFPPVRALTFALLAASVLTLRVSLMEYALADTMWVDATAMTAGIVETAAVIAVGVPLAVLARQALRSSMPLIPARFGPVSRRGRPWAMFAKAEARQKRSDGKRQTAPAADQLVRTVFQEAPGASPPRRRGFETSPELGVQAGVDRTEVAVGDPALLRQLKREPGSGVPRCMICRDTRRTTGRL